MKKIMSLIAALVFLAGCAAPQSQSCFAPLGRLAPEGSIEPTAEWGLGTVAGPYVFVAGMRGVGPEANEIVLDVANRVRQAWDNMLLIAASAGAKPEDLIETVVYIRTGHPEADFQTIRSYDNAIRRELFGTGPYPNRTIVGVTTLNGVDAAGEADVYEMKGTFYRGCGS